MKEKSCGTVLWTVKDNVIHYVLLKARDGYCGFPKGHVEAGESEHETALRETREETSIRAEIVGDFRRETVYKMRNGNEKTVVNSYTVVMYQDTIKNLMKISNVRHLLVEFGKTGKDDNGNAVTSADDKAAAKAKATELYEQWQKDGGTEEKLIELTDKCLEDLTAKDGGLLENITPDTNYVENFLKWSIDPERKKGDSEVIETEYGYHIMYFVDHSDLNYRDFMINNTLINEAMDKWYEETLKTVTATNKDIEKLDMVVNNNLPYFAVLPSTIINVALLPFSSSVTRVPFFNSPSNFTKLSALSLPR